ncbi:MAG: hypothetical protein IGQ45_05185 [Cyanobacterium sp. T60_A2020_053]|nr:hypothetical protein [Cyanobacterium sp. T60_A2020_053]
MEFGDFFEKIDQDLSQKVKDLQKKQEQLIEKQKQLAETKQKVQDFLQKAQELKKIIGFNAQLTEAVKKELNDLFTGSDTSALHPDSKTLHPELKTPNPDLKTSANQTKIEKKPDTVVKKEEKQEPKLPDLNLGNKDTEAIKIFKFVDTKGKNTSF